MHREIDTSLGIGFGMGTSTYHYVSLIHIQTSSSEYNNNIMMTTKLSPFFSLFSFESSPDQL